MTSAGSSAYEKTIITICAKIHISYVDGEAEEQEEIAVVQLKIRKKVHFKQEAKKAL